jgi:hypothetical protein
VVVEHIFPYVIEVVEAHRASSSKQIQ